MRFDQTDFVVEQISAHLSSMSHKNQVVESFLAQYLLVCIYSEIEENVKSIFRKRMTVDEDHSLSEFLFNSMEGIIRRTRKSDLVETVKLFGSDADSNFNGELTPQEITEYGRVISNRHLTAHQSGSSMTLDEVLNSIPIVKKVLVAFEKAIS